tara:strand:- start:1585 stop:2028 length:444 start_codon:yes stop_codon:yes gene_type:complete
VPATVKSVRQRVETAVDALTGFTISKQPYGVFGRDAASVLHQRFAVGVPTTEAAQARQRIAVGATVHTRVAVTYAMRIRPKDQVSSYDTALDSEAEILKAVMAENATLWAGVSISFLGVTMREIDPGPGEWMIGELEFSVLHTLALA